MTGRRTKVPLRVTEVIDYAVKAAVLLSLQEDEYLSCTEIAEHYGMSRKMLGVVLRSLAAAGLVVSRQGWHGGFRLAVPADTIPLRAVISAVGSGESLDPAAEPQRGPSDAGDQLPHSLPADRAAGVVDDFWRSLDSQIQGTLATVTVADLLAQSAAS